jgi:hypothetical protein
MKSRAVMVVSCSLAVLSAPALAADSHIPSTLAIETKAAPEARAALHAAKKAGIEERLLLGEAGTPLGASSKVGAAGGTPFVAEADVPITAAIETKAPRDRRASLHDMKERWAVERAILNQAWYPGQNANADSFRRGG